MITNRKYIITTNDDKDAIQSYKGGGKLIGTYTYSWDWRAKKPNPQKCIVFHARYI